MRATVKVTTVPSYGEDEWWDAAKANPHPALKALFYGLSEDCAFVDADAAESIRVWAESLPGFEQGVVGFKSVPAI